MIHATAIVDPTARLAPDVEVGAYCVIGPDVQVERGTVLESGVQVHGPDVWIGEESRVEAGVKIHGPEVRIGAHAILESDAKIQAYTQMGARCRVGVGAVLGGPPQDQKFRGERTYLRIGNGTSIREYVTIHRATGEGMATELGDDNLIMAYCHIGHNCRIGNGVSMANQAGVSGHVVIEDRAVIGGMVGVHQFVRIGRMAMVGGFSKVVRDVPPFMMADGRPTEVLNLNWRGLIRAGIPTPVRAGLKRAYRLLYRSKMNLTQAIAAVEAQVEPSEERDYLLAFLKAGRRLGRSNDPSAVKE